MNKKKHYKKQRDYFDKEFQENNSYKLEPWQKSYIQKISTHLLDKDAKKKTLIDIATGSGYIAIEAAKLGVNVIACDLSPQAIKNLEKYKKQMGIKNLTPLVCKAEEIPLKNGSVDYIVANAILEHIPEEESTIHEWKRILKRNGKMLITVPLKNRYVWPFFWPLNYYYDKRLGHLRRYDVLDLKNKFKLEVENYFYTGHFIKVIGAILAITLKFHAFDAYYEIVDRKKEKVRYGANNVSVILRK